LQNAAQPRVPRRIAGITALSNIGRQGGFLPENLVQLEIDQFCVLARVSFALHIDPGPLATGSKAIEQHPLTLGPARLHMDRLGCGGQMAGGVSQRHDEGTCGLLQA
jgi:hypothetical protein